MRQRNIAQIIMPMTLLTSLSILVSACNLPSSRQNIRRAKTFYRIGVKQSNLGQFPQALASLKQAEELNPNSYWIQEALGGTFQRMGKLKMALLHYKKALDIRPKSPRGNNNVGTVYIVLKQWENAILYFKRSLASVLYQTPCFARTNIAWAYHRLRNYKKSDKFFALATRTCPKICQAHRMYGIASFERKNFKKAKKSFRQLRLRCNKYLPGYYLLGQAHLALRELTEARKALQNCVDKSDKFPNIQTQCRNLLKKVPPPRTAQPNPIAAPRKSNQEKPFIYIKPHNPSSSKQK